MKLLAVPATHNPKTAFCLRETTDPAASQCLGIFTKNSDLRGQPAGGGLQSGNGRINDAVYRVGAWPAVQNICAASGDFARSFCMYGFRARSGYNDLVDHPHECGWRDVLAIGIFGRRLAQISDLYRTI
jgi:hypothetical protein